MVSGLLRAMETFASQRAWSDPDVYWIALLSLVNWICNVLMPVYAGIQVAAGAMRMGIVTRIHPTEGFMKHFVAAALCLMLSGLLRLAEFFVARGTAGVPLERTVMGLDVTPVYRNLPTRVTFL